MIYCSKCGTENEEHSKYCHSCGALLAQRISKPNKDLPIKLEPQNENKPNVSHDLVKEVNENSSSNRIIIFLLVILIFIILCAGLFFFLSLRNSSSDTGTVDSETAIEEQKEYLLVENDKFEAVLEQGSTWQRDVSDLSDEALDSISFKNGYYSVTLADGEKISGEYKFIKEPEGNLEGQSTETIETETDPDSNLILFQDLSSEGDAVAFVKVSESADGNALSIAFNSDSASKSASKQLSLTESDSLLDQKNYELLQSKQKAIEQQEARRQQAERIKQESVTSDTSTISSDTSDSSSSKSNSTTTYNSKQAETLKWDETTDFIHTPGVGAYMVNLTVKADGSFVMESTDHDAIEVYYGVATGKFSQPVVIDEHRCVVNVESIHFEKGTLPHDLADDLDKTYTNYDFTEDFPTVLTLYLPETPVTELDQMTKGSVFLSQNQTTLDKFVLSDGNRYAFFTP